MVNDLFYQVVWFTTVYIIIMLIIDILWTLQEERKERKNEEKAKNEFDKEIRILANS